MKVGLFFNDEISNNYLIDFFKQSKKINYDYKNLSNANLSSSNKNIIVLKANCTFLKFSKKLENKSFYFSNNTILFLPKKHNKTFIKFTPNIINYPIKYVDFENLSLRFFRSKKIIFKNLQLKNGSNLCNTKNNKQTHLTEIESKIILELFANASVAKKFLTKKVLNQSPLIDSKSLESHIYRLRKKLFEVDSIKKIVLVGNDNLKII